MSSADTLVSLSPEFDTQMRARAHTHTHTHTHTGAHMSLALPLCQQQLRLFGRRKQHRGIAEPPDLPADIEPRVSLDS